MTPLVPWLILLAAPAEPAEPVLEEVVVRAERLYRSRESMPAPTLIYRREFFEHFDPVAVGDMLKRVSSVAFSDDLGEFSAPQLRGLASQYTQVLVNGERVAGAGADRSVLVDRIPAELVERIEIIRSPGPELDAQGIGGTLNVLLRDGATLEGGTWQVGGHVQADGDSDFRGTASATYGGPLERGDYYLSGHYQERLFPKVKTETVFDGEGELDRVSQSNDQRDNTDLSLSAGIDLQPAPGHGLRLEGTFIDTEIAERERLDVFDAEGMLDEQLLEREDITQDRLGVSVHYDRYWESGATLEIGGSASRFQERRNLSEAALDEQIFVPFLTEQASTDDDDWSLDLDWALAAHGAHEIELGLGWESRERVATEFTLEAEDGELVDITRGNGSYRVDESRWHGYFKDTWQLDPEWTLEYGMRVEHTGLDQFGADGAATEKQWEIMPSTHLIFQPGGAHQFRASIARTLRRPAFDELIPFTEEDSPSEGQRTVGNPRLDPEDAIGLDLGYEHRFQDHFGIVGINFFYRDIDEKIELTQIGEDLFTPRNAGDGAAWGVEFDLSMPLDTIGWDHAGLYFNATWLDSEIRDPFTGVDRRFNFQPDYIANLDLIHQLPGIGVTWGLSVQAQGAAESVQSTEIKHVDYDPNLALFVEKSLARDFLVRLSVDNLLDARKNERALLFEGLDALQALEVDEFALETEQTGPVLLFTLSGKF